jgi:hypothetical protein
VPFLALGAATLGVRRGAENGRRLSTPARAAVVAAAVALAVPAVLVQVSSARLDTAIDAYGRGDCAPAVSRARSAKSWLSGLAEPYEIIGLCEARGGAARRGAATLKEAVEREPDNWEFKYNLGLVRAAAGRNPRRVLRRSLRENPRSPEVASALRRLTTPKRRLRVRRARRLLADADLYEVR